ncbi:MAG: sporulation protein [Actinobacteria bacterium]|nr:sporulation protein [Actinomycetota bacterium]
MDVQQMIDGVRDALTVRRVFGDPYERNGMTVIPVAKVQGGGGGGEGDSRDGKGGGGGGGLSVRPAGVFVVRGQEVRWRPAVDVNRLVVGAQVVAVVALVTWGGVAKAWLRRQEAAPTPG